MLHSYKFSGWVSWPLIRAHLCSLAVAMSFNSTWRVPRLALRHGGLAYGLILTAAMAIVALPLTLLQLAIGQLSQQDAVGVWRAVPFFKGVGYIRILISFLGSVYSMVYLALTITYFIYALSNSVPFTECTQIIIMPSVQVDTINGSTCLNQTFLSPVSENPEYYLAISLIVAGLWMAFPFMFYDPVKWMKRIYYALGPSVVILMIVVMSCIGNKKYLASLVRINYWQGFLEPDIWHAAVAQALLSSQIAGGYLILAGDSIYANTNVKCTTLGLVGVHTVASWIGLIFWFSVAGGQQRDTSVAAVLVHAYQLTLDSDLSVVWTILVLFTLILSGVITVVTFAYPVYERTRRAGGLRWRSVAAGASAVGAGASLAALAGRLPTLELLDDVAVPLFASLATILEILPFIFIYGWKILVEDVGFLTGEAVSKSWVWGWCGAPGVVAPLAAWWGAVAVVNGGLPATTVIAALASTAMLLLVAATFVVSRQVQYDLLAKLKASFSPARQWGPRDPITHYYWQARREELARGDPPRALCHRRQLGQLSDSSLQNVAFKPTTDQFSPDVKHRSNSDDWLFTVYRKEYISDVYREYLQKNKRRSKSFDWSVPRSSRTVRFDVSTKTTFGSKSIDSLSECNNHVLDIKVVRYTDIVVK